MRRPSPKREGRWTEIPAYLRKRSERDKCQVCGWKYNTMRGYGRKTFSMVFEALDHLIPGAAFVTDLRHDMGNEQRRGDAVLGEHTLSRRCDAISQARYFHVPAGP